MQTELVDELERAPHVLRRASTLHGMKPPGNKRTVSSGDCQRPAASATDLNKQKAKLSEVQDKRDQLDKQLQ